VIDDGLVLTIGYLITEAKPSGCISASRVWKARALRFDPVSGFGLVQALGRIGLDPLPLGSSAATEIGDRVVMVAPAGVRDRSQATSLPSRKFAGYWEYLLDEAIFHSSAHPNWGGTGPDLQSRAS